MNFIPVDTNVKLCVDDINPKCDKTVVFVHGWPLSREIFEYQLNVLPRHGIRCVGIDLRGFGDSGKPWDGYRYDCMAEDLHKIITAMNLKRVTLFGFSMGGAICVRYLARYGSGRVGKLVLCGAACPCFVQRPGYPFGKTYTEVDGLIHACYNDRPHAVYEFGKSCFHSEPCHEFLDWVSSLCMKSAGYSTVKALEALRDEELFDDLCRITAPTAIFHGLHDKVCPFIFASLIHEKIKGSFVVPFEKSGHALFYEEKEKCNSCLLDFIGVKVQC